VPTGASNAYSRNISALLLHLVTDGALAIDTTDEIQAGVVVAHGGEVVHPAVAKLLAAETAPGQPPGQRAADEQAAQQTTGQGS
jgi:NAD(P) transhydrogenase subunit alpha